MEDLTDGPETTNKFCVNCKFAKNVYKDSSIRCTHESAVYRRDLVTGETDYSSANLNRTRSLDGKCGEEALFFEPKEIKWYQFWRK